MKKKYSSFRLINGFILCLLAVICIYPFYYVLIYSLSDSHEALKGISFWPKGVTFHNYKILLDLNDIGNAFLVSTARSVLGTGITVLCCTFFAYLITSKHIWGRKIIYRFAIFTMYINAGIIPWYLVMDGLGLRNNFLLYIIPTALSAYNVILIKTYLESLPVSLIESAEVEGAGLIRIFWKIVLPLCKPILATIAVFAAVNQWNSYIDNLLLVTEPKLQTLQMILYNYLNSAQKLATMSQADLSNGEAVQMIMPRSIQATITVIVTVPILFVYPFMQRYFVKGVMLGAVKG